MKIFPKLEIPWAWAIMLPRLPSFLTYLSGQAISFGLFKDIQVFFCQDRMVFCPFKDVCFQSTDFHAVNADSCELGLLTHENFFRNLKEGC